MIIKQTNIYFIPHTDKKKFLNLVRFGVLHSMHPDVQMIAPQNLINSARMSPASKSNSDIAHLVIEKQDLELQIKSLEISKNLKDKEKLKMVKRSLDMVEETLAKKRNTFNSDIDISDIMKDARVVCSTLSSCINLKQYVFFVIFNLDQISMYSTEFK